MASPLAIADTVICNDGRRFIGDVKNTPEGYDVKTKFGITMHLLSSEVKEWVKDKPAESTKPASTETPAVAPAAGKTPASQSTASSKSIDALVKQGSEAILAGDYKAARDAFTDASNGDPRNAKALHGLGLAYLYLNQLPKALRLMERAMEASQGKPDRSLVLNMAMVQIGSRQPLRAVKFVRDYLDLHKTEPDEAMLNALGSGLFLTEMSSRKQQFWTKSADFYAQFQSMVEATKPGMKRWGVEWLPSGEVDKRFATMNKRIADADAAGEKADIAEEKLIESQQNLRRTEAFFAQKRVSQLTLQTAKVRVDDDRDAFEKALKQYTDTFASIVRPTYPRVLTPVALDDVTAATSEKTVASAMEDSVYKEAIQRAMKNMDPDRKSVAKDTSTGKPVTPSVPAAPIEPTPIVAIRPEAPRKIRVQQYAAAFAVSEDLVVTALAPLEGAVEFQLQGTDGAAINAQIVRKDEKTGLALLRVNSPDKKLAYFTLADSFPGGALSCAAFPTVEIFNPSAELLAGTGDAPKEGWKIKLTRHPRLTGSPLLSGTKVIGVVLATRESPSDQLPAVGPAALKELIGADAGKGTGTRNTNAALLQLMATREIDSK